MPEIYIYAELLLHIRQLTLHASLEEDHNQGSEVLVTSDKKVITAVYGEVTASVYLPTQIKGTANITFPTRRRTEFSTKLQIEDQNELQQAIDASPEIQVPWTASSLSPNTALLCKACHSILLSSDAVSEWKDMPNENWAELMDLWFCHKPHEHRHDDSVAAESKGFSAESKLMNEQGTGLVDTLSFLLHANDSRAMQIEHCRHGVASSSRQEMDDLRLPARTPCHFVFAATAPSADADTEESTPNSDLVCADCGSFVGTINEAESSHRLWKSRIALKRDSGDSVQTYDSSVFIGAQMLQLIESNISRRVVVHWGEGSGLLCWIFNPDVYYSSSKRGATVHRAMKIFYKEVDEPLKLLDENSTTLEELALPKTEFTALKLTLAEVKDILPASARTFQDWQVGLIDRHEANPSGLGAMDNNALNHPAENIELFKLPAGWDSLYDDRPEHKFIQFVRDLPSWRPLELQVIDNRQDLYRTRLKVLSGSLVIYTSQVEVSGVCNAEAPETGQQASSTSMTDLITSTFAQLFFFCFPCSRSKRDGNGEESDAEALEKARQWREKVAIAENGGKPPGYQQPLEMSSQSGARAPGNSSRHLRDQSRGGVMDDGGRASTQPGS